MGKLMKCHLTHMHRHVIFSYHAYLTDTLSYDHGAKFSQLSGAGFAADQGDWNNPDANPGLTDRNRRFRSWYFVGAGANKKHPYHDEKVLYMGQLKHDLTNNEG